MLKKFIDSHRAKRIGGVCAAVFVLMTAFWAIRSPLSSAAGVTVSTVLVAVCGNGIIEAPVEQCDDGSQCADSTPCTADANCLGIGDNLCKTFDGDGCSATCQTEVAGGGYRPPPVQNVFISRITAFPEQRAGDAGTNYDSNFYFSILHPENQNHQVLYRHSVLLSSNNSGVNYTPVEIPAITEGNYDIALKAKSHLTRILDNVHFYPGENFLNFTNETSSPINGSITFIAGDLNGTGNDPNSIGDDVINAVDLSILLARMGQSDPGGNSIRANLNQDATVNQDDLNILLNNLEKEGAK